MSFRPRSVAVGSLALAGLLALGACSSTPSHRRVVLDQIEALGLPAEQEACMKDVAASYDNDALDDIATAGDNEDIDWTDENALASATPELQEFVERLSECVSGDAGASESTAATASTEAAETTEVTETTGAADTTEVTETTGAAETTAG